VNLISTEKKKGGSWWRTPVINEAKRMRQEDHKFEASLGYTLKKKKKERKEKGRKRQRKEGTKEKEG
jgi:hypothetical protein